MPRAMINRKYFYDYVRENIFSKTLSQTQVDGMNVILDEWEFNRTYEDIRWLAYPLATTCLETDRKMQPIDEYGGPDYWTEHYDIMGRWPERAREEGNTEVGDGIRYHGRGFVQLTWKRNYRTLGDRLMLPLVENPDLAKEPDSAAKIMFEGMVFGLFTGAKLSDYFSARYHDPVNARRIINGTDRAYQVAAYYLRFLSALGVHNAEQQVVRLSPRS